MSDFCLFDNLLLYGRKLYALQLHCLACIACIVCIACSVCKKKYCHTNKAHDSLYLYGKFSSSNFTGKIYPFFTLQYPLKLPLHVYVRNFLGLREGSNYNFMIVDCRDVLNIPGHQINIWGDGWNLG